MKKHIISFLLLLLILSNGSLQAQAITLRIPDTSVVSGNSIDIPVFADNTLSGHNVMSYVIQLSFDPAYLQPSAVIVSGTLSAPFGSPAINTSVPGIITIAAAGTSPLTGAGAFIYIRFLTLQPGGTGINFTGTANNYFNEGSPEISFDDAWLNITAPPSITINPDIGVVAKGEQLQFNVFDGTPPYQWSVINPSVAAVDASGLLTAIQPGFTRVVAQDSAGIRDTTNQIEIRAMRMSIPSGLSQWQGADIDVPVNVTDLTGLNITSGNFAISFDQNLLTPVGIVQTGTLLTSFPAPVCNYSSPGHFTLAFAGTTPLIGTGTLIKIRFHVSGQNSGATAIDFTGGLFNEDLQPVFTGGYFTTDNLPVLSLTPNTGSLAAGETQQFTVNGGGVPPLMWNISDTTMASISQTGLMTAFRSGNVVVTVTDSLGATAVSGSFQIYDTRINMSDTYLCLPATTLYFPVTINALPAGESVFSLQAILNYDTTFLSFSGIETAGTLTQGWTFSQNSGDGQLVFAGSGSSPFDVAGTLLIFEFNVKPAFFTGLTTSLYLHNVILNEGIPLPLVDEWANITGADTPSIPVAGAIIQPTCTESTGSVDLEGLPPASWTINPGNIEGYGTAATIPDLTPGTYNFTVTVASGCTSAASSDVVIFAQPPTPVAEAGATAIYTGMPVIIGDPSSGPGIYSWSPAAGLSDSTISQPTASPAVTTTYTLTVDYNGCLATDTVTVVYGISGYTINGKTRYTAKANVGNPAPNLPTYNSVIYNIDHVIVVLKNTGGTEISRDTSDALGNFQFTAVSDGNYLLYYDKFTVDTMSWGNDINVADLSMLKYFIGSDTLLDPSRNFSAKYKRAVNVDNNLYINVADVSRLKAKIGSPYNVSKNFPKGNWVALTQPVTVAGSDLNITLETICYGDYNGSSSRYRDSVASWSNLKSLPGEFIVPSDESVTITNQSLIEVPLKISAKVKDFSALGLELKYPHDEYRLVSAYMPGKGLKGLTAKINPSFEEIMADHNDLLVTDEDGVIRVVYATTDHFDVAAGEELIMLGFRPLIDINPGELDFYLSGTGVVADQYGEENDEVYMLMPKIFVQGDKYKAGFELSGYPNPFANEAMLTYHIPGEGTVKIEVYNSLGEKVAVLVNKVRQEGKHSVEFSRQNMPSGIYTFRLEFTGSDGSENMTIKMMH
ncbi:MAG TPA: cohesin domain-containing protein [Bacteroidales bacterium]|nr:cohesin domain-containing protein [Bacteroidales bacterium]